MDIAQIVSICLNVLFGLFIFFGFIWGIKRGAKKSALRLGILIASIIIAAIVSPYISKALLDIKVGFLSEGENISVLMFLKEKLTSIPEVSELVENVPSIMTLITQVIIMVFNIVVFILLMVLTKIISWIIYAITSAIVFKKENALNKEYKQKKKIEEKSKGKSSNVEKIPLEFELKKPKKYRWWGGLIGAVQGLVLVFVLFLPINGMVGTVNDVLNYEPDIISSGSGSPLMVSPYSQTFVNGFIEEAIQTDNNSDSFMNNLPENLGEFVRENAPKLVMDIFDKYNSSAISVIGGIGGFDMVCFDSLTTVTVNNVKITLRSEINNVLAVYGEVLHFANYDWESLQYEDIDFTRMKKVVDHVFNLGTLKSIIPEIIPYIADRYVIQSDDVQFGDFTQDIKNIISDIIENLGEQQTLVANLKSDIFIIIDTLEQFVKSDIISEFVQNDGGTLLFNDFDNINIDNVVTKLTELKNGKSYVDNITDLLLSSKSITIALSGGFNIGLNFLEGALDEEIGRVIYSQAAWNTSKNDLKQVFRDLKDIYFVYSDISSDDLDSLIDTSQPIKEKIDMILDLDYETVLVNLGKIANILRDTPVLNIGSNQTVVSKLIDIVSLNSKNDPMFKEINEYLDLNLIKNANFEIQIANLVSVFTHFKNSELLEDFDTNLDNIDFNSVVGKLSSSIDDEDPDSETYLTAILEPILNNVFTRKLVSFGTDEANNQLIILLDDINAVIVYDYEDDFESYVNDLINLFDNLIAVVNTININDIKDHINDIDSILNDYEFIQTLTPSFTGIGLVLDQFKDSGSFEQIYEVIINKYKDMSEIEDFINLEKALDEDFSWENELGNISDIVNTIIEKGLIDLVMNSDENTMDTMLEILSEENLIADIFGPIMDSKLFYRTVIYFVNMMNENLSQVIESEEVIEKILDNDNLNISPQKDNVIGFSNILINLALDMINLGEDFDLSNINFTSAGTLLNLAKVNVVEFENDALLAGFYKTLTSYIAEYIAGIEGFGSFLSEGYPYLDTNWESVFNMIDLAFKMMSGDGPSIDDLTSILEYIGSDPEIEQGVKDLIIETIGVDEDDYLYGIIQDLDFSDEGTLAVVETIANLITDLSDLEEGADATELIVDFIEDLGNIENQGAVDTFINIIDVLIGGNNIGGEFEGEDVESIENALDGSGLTPETIDILKRLLGLGQDN